MKLFNRYLYFIYLLVVLIIGHLFNTSGFCSYNNMSSIQILSSTCYGDPVSFIQGAMDIYHYNWFQSQNYWIINFWPPGFMILIGYLLKIIGIDGNLTLYLFFISCCLFSYLMILLKQYFHLYVNQFIASIMPIIFLLFPLNIFFMLSMNTVVFGEGMAIIFFLMGILLVLKSLHNKNYWTSCIAGLMLALSTYFRSTYEVYVNFLMVFSILYFIFLFFMKLFKLHANLDIGDIKYFIVIFLVMNLLMLPWRVFHYQNTTFPPSLAWSATSEMVYKDGSYTNEFFNKTPAADFLKKGGADVPCLIDQSYCENPNKKHFYKIFFHNIIEWSTYKLKITYDYWFASFNSLGSVKPQDTWDHYYVNVISSVLIIVNIFLIFYNLHDPLSRYLGVFYLGLLVCTLGISLIVHLEVRYLFMFKIMNYFTFLLYLGPVLKKYFIKNTSEP